MTPRASSPMARHSTEVTRALTGKFYNAADDGFGLQVKPACSAMRMRGLEPPRGFPHTDLNRARLPIPPHPRGAADDDSNGSIAKLELPEPPSSRGLGRRPLTAETGVRIPVAVLRSPATRGVFGVQGPTNASVNASPPR